MSASLARGQCYYDLGEARARGQSSRSVLGRIRRQLPAYEIRRVIVIASFHFGGCRLEILRNRRTSKCGRPASLLGCFVKPGHPLDQNVVTLAQLRQAALVSVVFPGDAQEQFRKM